MLFDFSIIPIGGDAHTSEELAEALKIVHESGLRYQLTPSGTCIEGEWDEVMKAYCHQKPTKKENTRLDADQASERGGNLPL